MARPVIDITMIGDKELERKLARLATPASQKRAIRPSLRASAKRLKAEVVANLSGLVVSPKTGRLLTAMQAQKVGALPRSRALIGVGLPMPTRQELGIDPKDKYYYPAAVEYGHPGAPPYPYTRGAVDRNAARELHTIGTDIGKAIEREAAKTA